MDRKWPVIVAMRGDPYTGKTTLANALAKHLKFPTIRFDDILDVISANRPLEKPETLLSLAFDLISQVVRTHTSLGNSIIVDSPLSRFSHIIKLVRILTDSRDQNIGLSLVIVDCRPEIEYAWQMRLEERDQASHVSKWYKPREWPLSDPKFARDYTDDVLLPLVSKVVVDTTDHVSPCRVVDAVQDLSSCTESHSVDLRNWRRIHRGNPHQHRYHQYGNNNTNTKGITFCRDHPHHVHVCNDGLEGVHDYISNIVNCGVCQIQVASSCGGAYTCCHCPLAIHKSCAELVGRGVLFTPDNFPKFFDMGKYCYPEEHLCPHCREEEKEFSYECLSCIFESHMKCRLVPTVVRHQAHEHVLHFVAISVCSKRGSDYLCEACRRPGEYVHYHCEECKVSFHPECALLPTLLRHHKHGGYVHGLDMIFSRETELEDYLCDLCFDKMNPKAFYYSCNKCHLSLHLDCAFRDFDA